MKHICALLMFAALAAIPSVSAEILFESDWSTATGFSANAYTDGGKWDYVSGDRGVPNKEIVSTAGLDFPTANAYNVICTAVAECWSMLRKSGMPIPAVGESRYYRWYIRVTMPDGLEDEQTHPIQDGFAASQTNWMFIIYNGGGAAGIPNGQWQPQFWSSSPWPDQRWWGPNLDKHQTYRVELQIHRVSTTGFQMHVRVYDSAGTQVVSDADIYNPTDNSRTLASNPTFTFFNVNNLEGLNSGNNGIGGAAPFPFTYGYQAAFCVRDDDWCGPYGSTTPPGNGTSIPGDLNVDGVVNLQDLHIVIQRIGRSVSGDPRADVNTDGSINIFDVVRVARHWGNTASPPPTGDTTPPTASITAPANSATVNGTITITASAFDDVDVAGVQFLLDGQPLDAEDTAAPYSISWNTASVSNGAHAIAARARDAAGNNATSVGVTVTVSNAVSSSVLFFSDWRTTPLGNSVEALSDNGKWDDAGRTENGFITDAPAGFPTARVFRVYSDGTRDGWTAPAVTSLPIIGLGETRNYRWYHAMHEPATDDYGQHPIQDGGAVSQSNWFMGTHNSRFNLQDGQWGLSYFMGGNPDFDTNAWWLAAREGEYYPLTKTLVYRHEIQVVRTGTNEFRFHAWVYDANGNLLYDDDDFHSRSGTLSLASNFTHTFQVLPNTAVFVIGLNGISAPAPWPIHSSDQAAIAIVAGLPEGTPIGPYGAVTGELVNTPDTTPPTASITAPTANQVFAAGTTLAALSVTTNEPATCRWSTTDVAYGSMANTLAGSGGASHTATLTGLADGQSYTRYVRCQDTAGNAMTGSQSRSFSVAAASGGTGGVIFMSDWSAATGTSSSAITDGGKWPNSGGGGCTIVSSTGVDFPTANVLRAQHDGPGCLLRHAGMPIPLVGESRYYRWYFRLTAPDTATDTQQHPIQDGNAGSQINWMFITQHGQIAGYPNGQWSPEFWHGEGGASCGDWSHMYLPLLNKNQTYRFEMQLLRTGTDTYQMHIRVYDSAGTLLHDDDDVTNICDTARLSSNPTFTFHDVNNLDGLNAGVNGISPEPGYHSYQGAFCVRSDNWCGPYQPGEAST